jgi:AAA15 family ATPase/GTPase
MIALLNALLKKKLEPNEDFLELARKERDGAATLNFIKWIEDKHKGDDVLWRVPVLLLDEPDNHLSYRNTKMLFTEFIPNLARVGFQVIVVSHSPFSLLMKNANIIPIGDPNYVEDLRGLIKDLAAEL